MYAYAMCACRWSAFDGLFGMKSSFKALFMKICRKLKGCALKNQPILTAQEHVQDVQAE